MTRTPARTTEMGELGGRILVGVDFSPAARRALRQARSLVRGQGGLLFLLHVIDGTGIGEIARLANLPEGDLRERLGHERRTRVEALVADLDDGAGDPPTQVLVAWGRPFEEIVRKAEDLSVDLIVLGTSGQSADLERALFGSTAEKVLRSSSRPVLCVPAD